jgi:DNA sulfur modification protein DndB
MDELNDLNGVEILSTKRKTILFKKKIMNFLEKLEFSDIDGAREDFVVGGHQISACGGHENVLLVIECGMAEEIKKKSLKSLIYEFKGKIKDIQEGFKKLEKYKKYTYFRFILAVNDKLILKTQDFEDANKTPQIYIWTEDFLNYYSGLYTYLQPYVKYNMLGEMRINPVREWIQLPTFRTKVNKSYMYTFLIKPTDLLKVAYVARREVGGEGFYQRIIKKERLRKISEYINQGNIFPNNIIISFGNQNVRFFPRYKNEKKEFKAIEGVEMGLLEFPRDYRSCWIIDGQHRLYSFINSKKNDPIQVTAFQWLDLQKQGKMFLDINKNQKPVPPDLVWDLNGDLVPDSEDGIISRAVKKLSVEDFKSPLFRKIYTPSMGLRERYGKLLKIAGFCLGIKRTGLGRKITKSKIENPFYNDKSEIFINNLEGGLSNFYSVVKETFNEDWNKENKGFVLDDGGNSVIIRIFEKIISRAISSGIPKKEDYEKYLKPLVKLFSQRYNSPEEIRKLKLRITSEGGKDELLKEFVIYIKQETGDELFGGEIESIGSSMFRELEKKLKELINQIMEKNFGENWFEDKIPENIYKKAFKKIEKRGDIDKKKAYQQIIFGECIFIIRQYKNLFYPIFKQCEHGFNSDTQVEGAFDQLSSYKATQTSHDVGLDIKTHEETLVEIFLDKINKCITNFEENNTIS